MVEDLWYQPAQVTKCKYNGGQFQGNECRNLVRTATASEEAWSGAALAPFSPLFVSLEVLNQVVFVARLNLTQDDVQEIALVIQEFVDLWQQLSTPLGLGHPLKLHVLSVYVLQFCVVFKCTPTMYGVVKWCTVASRASRTNTSPWEEQPSPIPPRCSMQVGSEAVVLDDDGDVCSI